MGGQRCDMGKKKNKKKTTPKGAATPVKPTPPVQVEAPAPAEVDVVAAPVAPEPPVKVEAPAAEDAVASTENAAVPDAVAAPAVGEQELRKEASALFTKADRDKNGSLSHSELKKEIQQDDVLRQRLSAAKWKTFFLEIDVDGDGVITEEEFVTYYVKTAAAPEPEADAGAAPAVGEQELRKEASALFTKADRDMNGSLSHSELKKEIQQDDVLRQRLS